MLRSHFYNPVWKRKRRCNNPEHACSVSEIEDRDYGQTEFFVTDDDGYTHCFGVATRKVAPTIGNVRTPANRRKQRSHVTLNDLGRSTASRRVGGTNPDSKRRPVSKTCGEPLFVSNQPFFGWFAGSTAAPSLRCAGHDRRNLGAGASRSA